MKRPFKSNRKLSKIIPIYCPCGSFEKKKAGIKIFFFLTIYFKTSIVAPSISGGPNKF